VHCGGFLNCSRLCTWLRNLDYAPLENCTLPHSHVCQVQIKVSEKQMISNIIFSFFLIFFSWSACCLQVQVTHPIIYFIHLLHDVLIKFRFFFIKSRHKGCLKMGYTEPHNIMPSTSPPKLGHQGSTTLVTYTVNPTTSTSHYLHKG
jgi:hypothetical protein